MDIYIADITPFSDDYVFDKHFNRLPEHAKQRIERLKNKDDRIRSLGGYSLLSYGLKLRDADFSEIKTDSSGKPYIAGLGFHFNLSHSESFAAAVFSAYPTGIDIETKRKVNLRIAGHFFTEYEKDILKSAIDPDLEFLRIWTRKEAFSKATGDGILHTLRNDAIWARPLIVYGTEYKIDTVITDSYILSTAHSAKEAMSPIEPITLI